MSLTNREAAIAMISVLHKVDWAKYHLDLLDAEFEKYRLSDPHTIRTHDSDGLELVYQSC
jgi:hypothetical protein